MWIPNLSARWLGVDLKMDNKKKCVKNILFMWRPLSYVTNEHRMVKEN